MQEEKRYVVTLSDTAYGEDTITFENIPQAIRYMQERTNYKVDKYDVLHQVNAGAIYTWSTESGRCIKLEVRPYGRCSICKRKEVISEKPTDKTKYTCIEEKPLYVCDRCENKRRGGVWYIAYQKNRYIIKRNPKFK